jgi:hypothetical protein
MIYWRLLLTCPIPAMRGSPNWHLTDRLNVPRRSTLFVTDALYIFKREKLKSPNHIPRYPASWPRYNLSH